MADNTTSSTARKTPRKTTTRKAPAKKPASRRTPARKASDDTSGHRVRNRTVAALGLVGAAAAGVGWALSLGLFDKLMPRRNAEHEAPDLAADQDVHAGRAPEAFRPDPTASVPASEREGLRPATGPAPSLAATAGEMANQTA